MTTTTAPSASDIADRAEKAALIVKGNGLHKGYLYDEQQAKTGLPLHLCQVDAVGAINVAVFGQPCWPAEEHDGSLLAQAVVEALTETIGEPVTGWNDADDRTADEVVTALRNTVDRLREAS